MTNSSLKSQATKGMLWVAIEKFGLYAGQFAINIVLARLLLPKDFGLIGMLAVFIAIAQTFIDSGMSTGLVQKKDRTDIDFSTVFVFNFAISALCYLMLYFSAPYIAIFYDKIALIKLTRVLTLIIIINSLASVQRTKLLIELDFKTLAKINILSVIVSGSIGILFAYLGFGVWSLVIKNLTGAIFSVGLLWILNNWHPSLKFSRKSFNELFGFGSKLLLSGIFAQIFQNIYNIIIGKYYAAADLGYYSQSKKLTELSSNTVTQIIHKVSFPVLASIRDDQKRMISAFRKLIRMSSFIIFPIMTLLSLLADPLIKTLFNDNWLPVIPILQLLCFTKIFYPMSAINLNMLNANGRSDLFLKVDLSKIPITIIALLITVPLGIRAMIIGFIITSFIAFGINTYMSGKLFGYGLLKQLKDMLPFAISTIIMSIAVYYSILFISNNFIKLIVGTSSGIMVYLFVNYILGSSEIEEIKSLFKKIRKRNVKSIS